MELIAQGTDKWISWEDMVARNGTVAQQGTGKDRQDE
jgi:hypothetical protein